ncbi:T9SS type A sorting domain-containing protein [candidate division WOR-3 bacterium]|nr:T9SS type A sorting domain-containing protein [candidate division WOR-3 bacterium]
MIQWEDLFHNAQLSYCTGTPESWDIQEITNDTFYHYEPTITIDADGYIHMAYVKNFVNETEIYYVNNTTGIWVTEQVTNNIDSDHCPSLALDKNGNPHIVYKGRSNELRYITKNEGIWTEPEPIAADLASSSFPILEMDGDDNCHVVYDKNDGNDSEVYYANNSTGSWQEVVVTSNDIEDNWPTIFVDPDGGLHIAYMGNEPEDGGIFYDREIFYANNLAGYWSISKVTDNSVDDFPSRGLIADIDGIGHYFFSNESDGDAEIYHAQNVGPIYAVEENPSVLTPVSISLNQGVFASATVNYSIPRAGNVSLKVYDASGSLVKTLVKGTQQEGNHQIAWDGCNSSGTRVNAGVYFYHLTFYGISVSEKVIFK